MRHRLSGSRTNQENGLPITRVDDIHYVVCGIIYVERATHIPLEKRHVTKRYSVSSVNMNPFGVEVVWISE